MSDKKPDKKPLEDIDIQPPDQGDAMHDEQIPGKADAHVKGDDAADRIPRFERPRNADGLGPDDETDARRHADNVAHHVEGDDINLPK